MIDARRIAFATHGLFCLSIVAAGCTADNPLYGDGGAWTIEDLAGRDLAGRDLAERRDLSVPPDLATARDLATKPVIEVDVAEDAAGWDVGESTDDNIQPCNPQRRGLVSIDDDPTRKAVGVEAIRVTYGPSGASYFQASYPKARNANWDLSRYTTISGLVDGQLAPGYTGWDPAGPTIVLCSAGGFRRFDPMQNQTPVLGVAYKQLTVPIAGGGIWQAGDTGNFNARAVNSIEIHVDPLRGAGQGTVRLWIDALKFQ